VPFFAKIAIKDEEQPLKLHFLKRDNQLQYQGYISRVNPFPDE